MIRHIVMLRWKEGTTPEQVAGVAAALDAFAADLGLTGYVHGPDARLGEARWDYAIVGDFASVADWRAYDKHPEHVPVRELIGLHADGRAAVQLDLPDHVSDPSLEAL